MFKATQLSTAVRLGLFSATLGLSVGAIAAEEVDTTSAEKEKVERIEVTGSRISRTDMEIATPVTVITADDMKDQGFITAFDALQGLSQNTGTVQGNEFGAQGGFTPNADVIDLRGFGPGYTLVLLNGRRIADNPTPYNGQSNFVNLNGIPFAAIDRIEVVTQGSSAIYGSDAVAGVVNIILKKGVESTTVSAMMGTTKDGGGDQSRFSVVTGAVGSNYSVTAALEYSKQDPIYARDRDFMDSVDDNPAGAGPLARGILVLDAFAGKYRDPGEQKCIDSGSGYVYAERANFGKYCGVDTTGDNTIKNKRENISAYFSGTYDFSDSISGFADVMYSQMESGVYGSRHFFSEYLLLNTPDGSGNFAGGTRDYVLHQRIFGFNELGQRTTEFDESNTNVTLGLKGVLADNYDWKVFYSDSSLDYESRRDWLKEEAVTEYFLGQVDNPYGLYNGAGKVGIYDVITQDIRDSVMGTQVITADSYSRTFAAEISGDLFDMPAGAVGFAAVAEYNKQGYDLIQDERTMNNEGMGWQGLTGTEGGGDRDRYAVGLEVLVPVLDGLDVTLAGRYDQYDDSTTDVGGRLSPSVAVTYKPMDELMVRGTWGQSFRAPDMHYVFAGDSGYYSSTYDWIDCRVNDYDNDPSFVPSESNCNTTSFKGSRSGSKTLEEESGTNWGIGIVAEPIENLSFTLDYYSIKLEDIINDESEQDIMDLEYDCTYSRNGKDPSSAECMANQAKITRGGPDSLDEGALISIDTTPVNKSQYQQDGLDASIHYKLSTEIGDFGAQLNWTHILHTKYQATDESMLEDIRDDMNNYEPRSKTSLVLSYSYQDFYMAIRGDRTGKVPLWEQPGENYDPETGDVLKVDRLDPYYTVNLGMGYQFNDNLSVSMSAENIFNSRPETDVTHDSWPYYNSFSYPGAGVGATYRAEVSYKF
ncbi:TonB-dependent receptor domain-containing protein [Shewanella zhangzhouensis]|uniref:TonB-dependent receptor domain-containing protein n=1 Tax=Shewanella zhangzhouensis TaxID=2864213 RepID=UPI001C658544|nr:TonB-dependent receptor [Shewanella zhangzhouensis]QYK03705.1 TonB-dependent receptor [Shewanella zhangzhouensis]